MRTESFTPGATYALVNAATGARALMAAPTTWNGGATDASSGDKAWWFTFTSVTTAGDYYVLDVDRNVRSYTFTIGDTVYRDVLKQAMRMLFYQRAGQAKDAAHAGAGWTDTASFTGALQDQHCRLFSDKNNAATERDLRGGWYDAGDLNKYTSWTAGYVETLLRAYAENPTIWTDDTNIPNRATASRTCSTRRSGGSTSWSACRAPTAPCSASWASRPPARPPPPPARACTAPRTRRRRWRPPPRSPRARAS